MSDKIKTAIPFGGFYESWHSSALDDAIEQTFNDDHGEPFSPLLSELAYSKADWQAMFLEVAKSYVDGFAARFELKLEFSELISPREYNFTTDRIFCKIPVEQVKALFAKVDKKLLEKTIADRFTSYDGFHSYYANSLETEGGYKRNWPKDVAEWDGNQVETLILAYILQENGGELPDQREEHEMAFGDSSELSWQIAEENIKDERVWKILNYLREREEREYNKRVEARA